MKRMTALLSACALMLPLAACTAILAPDPMAPAVPPEIVLPLPEGPQESFRETEDPQEDAILPDDAPDLPARKNYVKAAVSLNVRTGAGTEYAALGQMQAGTLVELSGEENGWYATMYRGRRAYVSANPAYCAPFTLEAAEDGLEAVIAVGMRLLGTPYVYGAVRLHDGSGRKNTDFTADEFDCSSFMQYIFYEGAGVLLDVTTRTQIKQGVHVEREELARGDLMFFTNASRVNRTGIERVGHVALYLGENYILHTASGFAKAEQISSARWGYFLEARRVTIVHEICF